MNKQNFTSKFSNILEEEKQNQSGEMNGIGTETFRDRRRVIAAVHVPENERSSFPCKSLYRRGSVLF